MKKLLLIICAFSHTILFSSCSLIKDVNNGIAIIKGVNDGKAAVKSKIGELQTEARPANQGVINSNGSSSSQ